MIIIKIVRHSVMATVQDEQLAVLRQELKIWEKTFAAENGGRKAGREDIKRDGGIGVSNIYRGS